MLQALQKLSAKFGLSTTRSLIFTIHKNKMKDHEVAAKDLLSACGLSSSDDAHTHAGAAKNLNEMWTEYRKELELTMRKEKTKDHEMAALDLLSQEAHLS